MKIGPVRKLSAGYIYLSSASGVTKLPLAAQEDRSGGWKEY